MAKQKRKRTPKIAKPKNPVIKPVKKSKPKVTKIYNKPKSAKVTKLKTKHKTGKPKTTQITTKTEFMTNFQVGDGSHIETEIDKLYDLIKENGAITLTKTVKKTGFKEEQIRDWADVLEDHNMIDIDYPIMGDPILRLKKPKGMTLKSDKQWKDVEKKIHTIDRNHKIKSKAPLIPIALIGGVGAAIYLTNIKFMILDTVMTIINQYPHVSDFIYNLPYSETIIQNVIHILFGIYSLFVLLGFLIFRAVKDRGGKHKKKK